MAARPSAGQGGANKGFVPPFVKKALDAQGGGGQGGGSGGAEGEPEGPLSLRTREFLRLGERGSQRCPTCFVAAFLRGALLISHMEQCMPPPWTEEQNRSQDERQERSRRSAAPTTPPQGPRIHCPRSWPSWTHSSLSRCRKGPLPQRCCCRRLLRGRAAAGAGWLRAAAVLAGSWAQHWVLPPVAKAHSEMQGGRARLAQRLSESLTL